MIFRIKKSLFQEIDDYAFGSDGFFVKLAKLTKGYYIYGRDGGQVGQILFDKNKAVVGVADGAAILVLKDEAGGYGIAENPDDGEALKSAARKKSAEYMIDGNAAAYKYDIYEKAQGKPFLAASVIEDIQASDYYKLRIIAGSNALKLLMLAISIDKLNQDPDGLY